MEHIILGLQVAFQPENFWMMLVGSLIGTLVGALPGIGAAAGIALLLPFTYNLPPITSLLLLVSLYQACEYGGSITSILVSIPGNSSATATIMDGYPLCRKGYPGKALGYSLTSSTIGGFFGVAVLILFSAPIARFALQFGPPEYLALGVFGLTAVASLSSRDIPKSVLSVIFGLLLTTVGVDVFTSYARFSFGKVELLEGIPIIPLIVGLFAISEVYKIVAEELAVHFEGSAKNLNVWLTLTEIKSIMRATLLGSVIGTLSGVFPGMGAGPASWLAYTEAKRHSKNPELFGTGHPDGIAAPEAANNAIVGGNLIPLMSLGIPASATSAVLLSALMIQGIQPGPQIFEKMPELVYGLYAGLLVSTGMMYLIGLFTTNFWARCVNFPNWFMAPLILVLSIIGCYVERHLLFDIWMGLIFGLIGYFLQKFDYSLPSVILGYVLGFLVETNLRRSLLLSEGSYTIFFNRPISLIILILAFSSLAAAIWHHKKQKKRIAEQVSGSGHAP